MSTLQTVNIKNPFSTVTNAVLNSDGTTTFGGVVTFAPAQTFPSVNALPLTGGTMTGSIVFAAGQTFPNVLPLSGGTMTGSIVFTSTQPLGNLQFMQSGAGAVTRLAQSKMRDIVSVKDFGAVGDGVSDDTAAIQAALNANSNVCIPLGSYGVSSQITVPSGRSLTVQGELVFLGNPSTPTTLFNVVGSDTAINFTNSVIDGLGFPNWVGVVSAGFTTGNAGAGMLKNVRVFGGRFVNIGVNNTSTGVIGFNCVRGGEISGTYLENCGVVGNVSGGGFGIYTQYCEGLVIEKNTLIKVGSTGINLSAGLNNVVRDNTLYKITLFGMKGGYGFSGAVTNNVPITSTSFSVPLNTAPFVGQAFFIPRATYPGPQGVVKSVVKFSTYEVITTAQPMAVNPVVGEGPQPLDTNALYSGNSIVYTGDNGFDQNGVHNLCVQENRLSYSGEYEEVGSFPGLRAGIWVGYDPQGPINNFENTGLIIQDNVVEYTRGSAIQIFVTNDVIVQNNYCYSYSGQDTSSNPNNGGIEFGKLGFYRNTGATITGNTCVSQNGFGIFAGYSTSIQCSENHIRSKCGIKANTVRQAKISGNLITATGTGVYGLLISDDSGTNPGSGCQVTRNVIGIDSNSGYCIRVSDVGMTLLDILDDNLIDASGIDVVRISDESTASTGTYPRTDGVGGRVVTKPIRFSLGPGQTVDLGSYFSDPGTVGGLKVYGFMRSGTSSFQAFEVMYFGNTSMPVQTFTDLGSPNGTTFLSGTDFTTSLAAANRLVCNYTNNETDTVYATLWAQSFARF